jgi:hypothetical protein
MGMTTTETMGITGMENMKKITPETMGITGMESMKKITPETMGLTAMGTTMGLTSMENMCKPWSEYMGNQAEASKKNINQQPCPCYFEQLDLSNVEAENLKNKQPVVSNGFNISGNIGKYFEKIAEGFAPYFGKLIDINYCKWYKIDVNSIGDLSDDSNYNQYTLAYYPMLNYYPYISKAGHFLLGYKCNKNGDMQYIIYAIPGSKAKNDQPYSGRTGFVTWTSDDKSGKGYWLMFYDFKKSSIVIPTR